MNSLDRRTYCNTADRFLPEAVLLPSLYQEKCYIYTYLPCLSFSYQSYNLLILFQAFLLEIQTCVSYAYLFFQLFPPELSSLPRSDCSLICSIVLSDSPAVLANEYNTIRTIIINAMLNPITTLSSFKLVAI